MKRVKIIGVLSLIVLYSCTQTNKEARLQQLIEQRKDIDVEIETLKKEIAADGDESGIHTVSTLVITEKIKLLMPKSF